MINSTDNINILIDKLFIHLIKIQVEDFKETKQFINDCIAITTQTTVDIFNWLKENQYESKYAFFLGIFSYYNILGLEENNGEGFSYLLKTADNCPIAQLYLGKCYKKGFGTEVNNILACYWMQKAGENGIICAQ